MADFDSQLPIRSAAADAAINVEQFNGNTVSTGSGAVDVGTVRVTHATDVAVNVDIDSLAGNAIATGSGAVTNGTIRVTHATDVPVNVDLDTLAGNAISVNTGNADNGTQRVVLASDQPTLNVNVVSGVGGTNVHNYSTATVNAAASSTHSFNPGANFVLQEIYYAASGQMKIEIQWGATGGETTKSVAFTSKSTLTGVFRLTDGQLINTTDTIKVIRTNLDNQAMDVYTSIHGVNA